VPGREARRAFLGHAQMENRSGLIVDACLTKVCGHAERIAALAMIEPRPTDRARSPLAPTAAMTPSTSLCFGVQIWL